MVKPILNTEGMHRLRADAEHLPVVLSQSRLSARDILANRQYANITDFCLAGDPAVAALLRACGVDEVFVGGNGSDYEKFRALCLSAPRLVGNPTLASLQQALDRVLGVKLPVGEKHCDEIWRITAERLADPALSLRGLLTRHGVERLGVCEDATADLSPYAALRGAFCGTDVLPVFLPGAAAEVSARGLRTAVRMLEQKSGVAINDLATLTDAYRRILDDFVAHGCRVGLHTLSDFVFVTPDPYHADRIFRSALEKDGKGIPKDDAALFASQMLRFFAAEYTARGMVMQLHFGIGTLPVLPKGEGVQMLCSADIPAQLARLFAYLTGFDILPRIALYPANGMDLAPVAALCVSFSRNTDGTPRVALGGACGPAMGKDRYKQMLATYAAHAPLGCLLPQEGEIHTPASLMQALIYRRAVAEEIAAWCESGRASLPPAEQAKLIEDMTYTNAKAFYGR